ncbi:MAG: carbohydrate kinase [Eubacterium sp.]|nr:carbohydrate kinase [Eubacterium sp.]
MDVVALGELLIDFTENGLSEQDNPLLEANPGGAPCNVLAMLKKYGHDVGFIGKVGRDMFGDQLERAIRSVGIETEGLLRDETVNTTLAFVKTLEGGDREFSFYRNPGADMMLSENDVENCRDLIESCRIFHIGSLSMTDEVCERATKRALAIAKEAGALVSFDPNLREPLWDTLEHAHEMIDYGLSQCDILKISDNEITWFTGEEDYDAGVKMLRERYNISLILVSMGPEGSLAFSGNTRVCVKPFIQKNTIETTGAGDTFCAGVLHYVLEHGLRTYNEAELKNMLTTANAGASIITTRRGALSVMPDVEEIRELIRERSDENSKREFY